MHRRAAHRLVDQPQYGGMQPVDLRCELRITAVHRQRILRQVVGPGREEVGCRGEDVGADRCRRGLDHHTELHRRGLPQLGLHQLDAEFVNDAAHRDQLGKTGDHRQQDAALAGGLDAQDRGQLIAQQRGLPQPDADAAQAERRIVLGRYGKIRHRLVATDVERADDQRAGVQRRRDRLVQRRLLVDAGRVAAV